MQLLLSYCNGGTVYKTGSKAFQSVNTSCNTFVKPLELKVKVLIVWFKRFLCQNHKNDVIIQTLIDPTVAVEVCFLTSDSPVRSLRISHLNTTAQFQKGILGLLLWTADPLKTFKIYGLTTD